MSRSLTNCFPAEGPFAGSFHERTTLSKSIPVSGTVSLNEWLSEVDDLDPFSEPGMDQLF